MRSLVACLMCGACVHIAPVEDDPTLVHLDEAFMKLRDGEPHGRVRKHLEKAASAFDDLALDGSKIERALATDVDKPYRGRPHERVLASIVLAALDIERERCDLALPTLRNAAFMDLRRSKHEVSDAPIIYALMWQCLDDGPDKDRAHEDYLRSCGTAPCPPLSGKYAVVLDGDGPIVETSGAYGEKATLKIVSRTDIVERSAPAEDGVVIGCKTIDREGYVMWSSGTQASTVGGRPFDDILAGRAALKKDAHETGSSTVTNAINNAKSRPLVATAIDASLGASLIALGAAVDARADARYVDGLFERALLVPCRTPKARLRARR